MLPSMLNLQKMQSQGQKTLLQNAFLRTAQTAKPSTITIWLQAQWLQRESFRKELILKRQKENQHTRCTGITLNRLTRLSLTESLQSTAQKKKAPLKLPSMLMLIQQSSLFRRNSSLTTKPWVKQSKTVSFVL